MREMNDCWALNLKTQVWSQLEKPENKEKDKQLKQRYNEHLTETETGKRIPDTIRLEKAPDQHSFIMKSSGLDSTSNGRQVSPARFLDRRNRRNFTGSSAVSPNSETIFFKKFPDRRGLKWSPVKSVFTKSSNTNISLPLVSP